MEDAGPPVTAMKIEVRLFATLTHYLPPGSDGRRVQLSVAEGATAGQILDQLGVPRGDTKLIFIDSVHGDPSTTLQSGSVLSVFPPIAGGQAEAQ